MKTDSAVRTALLRRQGTVQQGFALLTAVLMLGMTGSPVLAAAVGAMTVWTAWRGRTMVDQAGPLSDDERREIGRLATDSRAVREFVGVLAQAGQQPVRWDLQRCRKLARVESLIDGRA